MNKDQILSIARSVLKLAAGVFAAKGIGDGATWDLIIAGILAAGGLGWSHFDHKKPA